MLSAKKQPAKVGKTPKGKGQLGIARLPFPF
jgi:hypothetical protein